MKSKAKKTYKKFMSILKHKIKKIKCYIEFRGDHFLLSSCKIILKIAYCGIIAELSFFGLCFLNDPLKYIDYPIMNILNVGERFGSLVMMIVSMLYLLGAFLNYYCWSEDYSFFHSDILLIATEDITNERGIIMYRAGERICTGTLNMSHFDRIKGHFEIIESNKNGYYTAVREKGG